MNADGSGQQRPDAHLGEVRKRLARLVARAEIDRDASTSSERPPGRGDSRALLALRGALRRSRRSPLRWYLNRTGVKRAIQMLKNAEHLGIDQAG